MERQRPRRAIPLNLPALALASHYPTLPHTANYIYALLYFLTKIRLDSRCRSYEEFAWLCAGPNQPLKPEAQKRYDIWLMNLVPHLRLVTDNEMDETCCATAYPGNLIAQNKPGVTSKMSIGMFWGGFWKTSLSSRPLLLRHKHLANTVIHELIHSITYAHSGQYWCEDKIQAKEKWFAQDEYVEAGVSWEQAVMGGELSFRKHKEELWLHEMDRREMVMCYKCADPRTNFPVDCTCKGQKGYDVWRIEAEEVMGEFEELLGERGVGSNSHSSCLPHLSTITVLLTTTSENTLLKLTAGDPSPSSQRTFSETAVSCLPSTDIDC